MLSTVMRLSRCSDSSLRFTVVMFCPAGSSKLVIQRVEVKDRQGLVGEAPGLEPGMIVSAWNPDESWIQDALLRVNATKGVPTLDLNVWSLVDVMVHPLGVHIHQQVANSLWVRYSHAPIAISERLFRQVQSQLGPCRILHERVFKPRDCDGLQQVVHWE